MNWVAVVSAGIGAVGGLGGLAALAQAFINRPKIQADAAEILTGSALEIVRQTQARVVELERHGDEQRRESAARMRELESEVDRLHQRIRELERTVADRDATIVRLRGTNGNIIG